MHNTYDTWPQTVGVWEDKSHRIAAVVNSEGENKGEAFIQKGCIDFTDDFLSRLIGFAEERLYGEDKNGRFINLRVNEDDDLLKRLLLQHGYTGLDWTEPSSSFTPEDRLPVNLHEEFMIADANTVNNYQKGFAHGKAFGYHKNDSPDDDDTERAYTSLRKAPDYRPELDVSVLDNRGEIAAFATVWFDDINALAILEPVGTIPMYRKRGLGRAVIYEGINRAMNLGAERIIVGSDQPFYKAIGFQVEFRKEIWQKRLSFV
ncbi:MAG: GNAT family N-acetyltransferase [Spirochaetales bacterium]|nr:GNAT family N-acetyltransferase [Spirochaetales bacterium]